MSNTPAGLTSSVTADGRKYILQTEFLVNPEPHIVTTVEYHGQVIHKVEKICQTTAVDTDAIANAEKAIKNQHISVARAIAARPRDFTARPMEIQVSAEDRLRLITGVAEVTEIDHQLQVDSKDRPHFGNQVIGHIGQIRDVVMALSGGFRMGRLKRAVGTLGNQKFVLTGFSGKTYLLGLKPDVDISRVLKELESANI
jgi:hypothetical protein